MESDSGDGNLSASETDRRQCRRLVDKQRGRCASCRGGLSANTARVRVEVYRIGDLDELNAGEIRVTYAQCAPCFGLERPRADGYKPGTPLDTFFAQFRRRERDGGPLE